MNNNLARPRRGAYLYKTSIDSSYSAAIFTVPDEQLVSEESCLYRGYVIVECEDREAFDQRAVDAIVKQGYIFTDYIHIGATKQAILTDPLFTRILLQREGGL